MEKIRQVLGWCTVINFGILIFWTIMMLIAKDLIVNMQANMFGLNADDVLEIHFNSMAIFKLAVFIFNFAPYIAIRIIENKAKT